MNYEYYKDLPRRTAAINLLHDKAFNIAKNLKYYEYQRGLASMFYKCLDKKTSGDVVESEIVPNQKLAEDLHNPVITNFEKHEVYSLFKDNICGADFADMQLISIFNERIRFLLRIIDIYSKYEWVVPLKDKRNVTITNAFQKILDKSGHKPNKIWVDKDSELYNRSMKSWLQDNNIDMYSTHIEEKCIVVERFIRTLKNKIYKYMTSISKTLYVDKLVDIVNKYKNSYLSKIEIKSIDVKSRIYIDLSIENNEIYCKFNLIELIMKEYWI